MKSIKFIATVLSVLLASCGGSSSESSQSTEGLKPGTHFVSSTKVPSVVIDNTPVSETWYKIDTKTYYFGSKVGDTYFSFTTDTPPKEPPPRDPRFPPPKPTGLVGPFKTHVSKDAKTWQTAYADDRLAVMAFDGKHYYARDWLNPRSIYRSADALALKWQKVASVNKEPTSYYGAIPVNILFHKPSSTYIGVDRGLVSISNNGKDWRFKHLPHWSFNDVHYFNGRFITLGAGILTSTDGETWENLAGFEKVLGMNNMVSNDQVFMMRAAGGIYIFDKQKWHVRTTPKLFGSYLAQYKDGFITDDYAGALYKSTDGVNWQRLANLSEQTEHSYNCSSHPCVAYKNNLYAIVTQ